MLKLVKAISCKKSPMFLNIMKIEKQILSRFGPGSNIVSISDMPATRSIKFGEEVSWDVMGINSTSVKNIHTSPML